MIIALSALFSAISLGFFVRLANHLGWGKPVRKDGPKAHLFKEGTPTMGGLAFLLVAFTIALPLLFRQAHTWAVVLMTLLLALAGWADDVISLRRKRQLVEGKESRVEASTGLLARYRLLVQAVVAIAFALYAVSQGFAIFSQGLLDVLAFSFLIMFSINAINFCDGLDGLASGIVILLLLPFLGFHFAAILVGCLLGFLWFNAKPAKVFMGGVGSEALGAAVAGIYIIHGYSLLAPIMAIVPVVEVFSVIIQVTYFRLSGGKRLFRMSPIHHHFELIGWAEETIVLRFWLITAVAVALGYWLKGGWA